ncbi:hypothetical protein A4G99_16545 [Haladaptatus sp. R4]|uniref:hypothetical protein n=1 Tax=Haladaptatus sp. R4 TaxID=1679489 RepID=UPI0007B49F8B|nr:hypothetical protein [Haladaptatus sp. R4]KZN23106.1 hypothetical protein A4G99_16545 [Haladaptatus sp. R4]
MGRRWFLVLGIFLIIGQLAALVAYGIPVSSELSTIITFLTTCCAGILFVIGGTERQFKELTWNQFVGAADFLLGLLFVLGVIFPLWNTSAYESSIQLFFAIAAIGGTMSLMLIGIDWVRGGHYSNFSSYESDLILSRR